MATYSKQWCDLHNLETKPNFDKWLEGLDDLEVIDTSPSHPTAGAPTDGS